MRPPRFLSDSEPIVRTANRLPHWQQDGRTYFLTWHLADSLPAGLCDAWRNERETWLQWNPCPWTPQQEREYFERFGRRMELALDELHGSCLLRQPDIARVVAGVLRKFDGARYQHHAFVIMPNHVHVLVSLAVGTDLTALVKAWKGASARAINRRRGGGGSHWQKDYYDRLIRDGGHFWNVAAYILRNPRKAKLRDGEYLLHEGAGIAGLKP
jgi:putative transposase